LRSGRVGARGGRAGAGGGGSLGRWSWRVGSWRVGALGGSVGAGGVWRSCGAGGGGALGTGGGLAGVRARGRGARPRCVGGWVPAPALSP
jgi:hypothetical protein